MMHQAQRRLDAAFPAGKDEHAPSGVFGARDGRASVLVAAPSLARRLKTWTLAVFWLMKSSSPIWRLEGRGTSGAGPRFPWE